MCVQSTAHLCEKLQIGLTSPGRRIKDREEEEEEMKEGTRNEKWKKGEEKSLQVPAGMADRIHRHGYIFSSHLSTTYWHQTKWVLWPYKYTGGNAFTTKP